MILLISRWFPFEAMDNYLVSASFVLCFVLFLKMKSIFLFLFLLTFFLEIRDLKGNFDVVRETIEMIFNMIRGKVGEIDEIGGGLCVFSYKLMN